MSTSGISLLTDPIALKPGDKIKMRGPDGVEREGTFLGSLTELATDGGKAPIEHLRISDDLTMTRQGALYRMEGAGAGKLTFAAHTVLMSAFDAGAETASDYLKGLSAGGEHPLYQDRTLTMDDMRNFVKSRREASEEGESAADGLLRILQQHIQPKFHHHVAAGESLTGSDGDDAVAAADGANIAGMDGNDWIDGRENLRANGGSGNDVIEAYGNAKLAGGTGDDRLTAYNNSVLDGGSGNDHLGAGSHARISGGEGHDYISTYGNATVDGGSGNDYIDVYGDSSVTGGDGHDFISAGSRVALDGGTGDDIIRAGDNATITGGLGDDTIRVGKDAVIHFGRGDGADAIEMTGRSADGLSSARIVFGPGIAQADIAVTREGDDLRVAIAGTADSLLIRNLGERDAPSLVFADGTVLAGAGLQPNIPA